MDRIQALASVDRGDADVPGVTIQFRHRFANPEAGIGLREKMASMPAYYTRRFCRACNGGWMSRLEDRTRPVLEPQSQEDQLTLFARPVDFRTLYEQRRALPFGQVWLGANVHGEAGWYRGHSVRLPDAAQDAVSGFGAMLTVGFAVFYGVFLFDADAHLRLRGDGALALRELTRGRREMRWPPPLGLGEVDLTGLPEALAGRSRLIPNDGAATAEGEAR